LRDTFRGAEDVLGVAKKKGRVNGDEAEGPKIKKGPKSVKKF
jgi:hypothetical protein